MFAQTDINRRLALGAVVLSITFSVAAATAAIALDVRGAPAQTVPNTIDIRGHRQTLIVAGSPEGEPVIVSSGDGGWIHLGPHVADVLARHGYFVIGFDSKAYLESFTERQSTLQLRDEPGDYRVLVEFAQHVTGRKPILVGVSEGAGLSVLAATDPHTKSEVVGLVTLGLPDMNELAWRWKDAVIYLTHRVPDEPLFSSASIVGRVAPVPLAAIHSTHDEFVPVADVQRIIEKAGEPKRLWLIASSNHRFSDNLDALDRALLDALAWVAAHRAW